MSANTWNCSCGVDVPFGTTHYCGGIAKTVEVARLERRLAAKTGEADFAWTAHAEASQREQSLRAAIEKLRDDTIEWNEKIPPALRQVDWVARRLTEILEGEK